MQRNPVVSLANLVESLIIQMTLCPFIQYWALPNDGKHHISSTEAVL